MTAQLTIQCAGEQRLQLQLCPPNLPSPCCLPPCRLPATLPLLQVSRKEMQATLALRFGGEGILKVKGIPFKACAADVRKFFSGYKIKVGGVSFIMHADGRPTGMAFIEFATPQEAVRAMVSERAATSSEQRAP